MNQGKKIITGLIVLLPFFAFGQTVDFSFSTDNGLYCSPQRVTFTQNCTGTPDGFIWRFGNGLSGIQPIESTTYTSPGTYPVTLIAIYADVAISITKNVVINPSPMISINADKYEICQPGTIIFTAPGSPFITSYEWDFADGSPVLTTSGNTASHFFTSYSEYIVRVKGITAAGCSAAAFDTVAVKRFGIDSGFVNPRGGCIPAGTTLSVFPNPPLGDPAINYYWDFGDGSPSINTAGSTVPHMFTITATITTASVIVTTASGCTSQFIYPEFGFGTPPTNAVASTTDGRDTYCASELIEFAGAATGAEYFMWDYGDGIVDSILYPTITHRYRSVGMKRVIMTPLYHGCPGTPDTLFINVIGVAADYTYSNLCTARNHFIFTNTSSGNVSSFRWTFSDIPGSPDVVNYNTSHTFPANGAFTAKLYLYDAITGCSDSLITDIFTATPILRSTSAHVCKDSTIKYTVENPYPPGSGYLYVFYVDGPIIAHTIYPELELEPDLHGIFNEYVIILGPTNNTCNDTVYLSHPTKVGGPVLQAYLPFNACLKNNSFLVTNNSRPFFPDEPFALWEWDFGDGTTSNLMTPPPHSYDHPGTFWVHFRVTDMNGCAQNDSQLVRVNPTPEIYVLPGADTLCAGDTLQLLAFTVDNLQWTTNYNISCLTCDTAYITPAVTTSYVALATNIFDCTNTDTAKIKVYPPFHLQVSPADTAICIGDKIQFNTNVNGIINWSPPNYLNAINIRNPISIPDSSIVYKIVVSDSVGCFADSAIAVIHVNYKPTVDAGPDKIVPYYNSFTISPAYSSDVVSYRWSPPVNGLSCITCPVASGTALQTTTYSIEATNTHGCKAKDNVAVIIACNKANLNLPSAFTPNNDGLNDQFYPLTRGYKTINRFVVYNRWGNIVFERYNFAPNIASLGWSGTTKDKQPMDTGVFIWVIEATCDLGEKVESKGTVTLVR